jgi:CTP synthase
MIKSTTANKEKKTKYIFVTGGVVSGIGKGICAASIGHILKSSGVKVEAMKMDPYLNVDPGTMSPYEHGEVFVLKDGKETDLDLGNYERFLDVELTKESSFSSGSIYSRIIEKERNGDYLGKTVQIIPHVTDYIQSLFEHISGVNEVKIIEIGGSTGDMEAEVYLESLRQFKAKHIQNVLHVHLGYLPFLKVVGEYKSKPLQNSIKELLKLGLTPNLLVLRYEPQPNLELKESTLEKIALHCNVNLESIIKLPDLDSIYKGPKHLLENTKILERLGLLMEKKLEPKLVEFFIESDQNFTTSIKIALIAKYSGLQDSYYSVLEALKMSAFYYKTKLEIEILDSCDELLIKKLENFDGFVVPGGFGIRGLEEKISAIKWIRENKKPFLGICLGLQMAVLEFLRNKAGIVDAITAENPFKAGQIAIEYMANQKNLQTFGATMRLGDYTCTLENDSLAHVLYAQTKIVERHRHRLEVVNSFVSLLEKNGMKVSGKHFLQNKDEFLVELVELDKETHPFFIATQAHPEFLARPNRPHPLFSGLVKASLEQQKNTL